MKKFMDEQSRKRVMAEFEKNTAFMKQELEITLGSMQIDPKVLEKTFEPLRQNFRDMAEDFALSLETLRSSRRSRITPHQ